MTDNKLRVLVTVARTGSFTEAARLLGCSQPLISQTVSGLEQQAGGPLLERSKGSVRLTPRGIRFCEYARQILSLYEKLDAEMHGGALPAENVLLDLGDGKSAEVSVHDGKLEISLKSANY